MKLSNLIGKLETQTCINSGDFLELKKRAKQVKKYFALYDKINVVGEIISNNLTGFYIDTEGTKSHYDIIEENNLFEQLESGHVFLLEVV